MPEQCNSVKQLTLDLAETRQWLSLLLAIGPPVVYRYRLLYLERLFGAVAQLGERCVRNAEVEGSTPFRSTSSC
jgi:hypothetical protein